MLGYAFAPFSLPLVAAAIIAAKVAYRAFAGGHVLWGFAFSTLAACVGLSVFALARFAVWLEVQMTP
ncbi:MAG: hypothetical protein ABR591_00300, partial [Candidatus Velthaea sp.]